MPTDSLITRDLTAALTREATTSNIIQSATEESMVLRMGRRLPNMSSAQTRMPVLDALPIAYFVDGDTGLKQTTEAAWDSIYLNAEELAVIVPIPDAVIADASYSIWEQIRPLLTQAFGQAIDAAILVGTNAPASWPDSILDGATIAGNTVTVGSVGDDLYDDIMGEDGLLALVEEDGFMVNGHVAHIKMRARLRGLRDLEGRPLYSNSMQDRTRFELDGSPLVFNMNNAFSETDALMFSGDFSKLVYAFRQEITITMTNTGVIQNADGTIAYNLFQQDMTALRAVMRLAWALPNPLTLQNDDPDTRYPFAVLTEGGGG